MTAKPVFRRADFLLYLILQVLFSSIFGLAIKWVQVRGKEDIFTIGALNYIVAFLLTIPLFLQADFVDISPGAVWTGGSMGGIYFIAYFFCIYCVREVGVSSTTVVSVLSILFPIAVAAVIWSEVPNSTQVIGILFALSALLMIGLSGKAKSKTKIKASEIATTESELGEADLPESRNENLNAANGKPKPSIPASFFVPLLLLGFFMLCGLSRVSQDTFKHVSESVQRPTFLLAAFGIASVPSLVLLLARRKAILPMEVLFGIAMGLSNVLQSHYILRCLENFPGYVVFPVVSAGQIVLTTLVATSLLKERLSAVALTGIGLAVAALFMLY